jgi:hypothetical protein
MAMEDIVGSQDRRGFDNNQYEVSKAGKSDFLRLASQPPRTKGHG